MNDKKTTSEKSADQPGEGVERRPRKGNNAKAKRFNWSKWLGMAGTAVVVVALGAWMLWPSSVKVEVAVAKRGPLSVTVDEQGRTRAKERYTVGAPISGRVMRSPLDVGDRVERGDVLARIAPPPTDARTEAAARADLAAAEARARQANAVLNEANSALLVAHREAVRRAELFGMGMISIESRDTYAQAAQAAEARVGSARASLAAAQADVQSARSHLLGADAGSAAAGLIEVRAPVSGQVLQVHEQSERVVPAGTPLFDLSQGNALELVVDVLTQQGAKVHAGNAIRITGWGGAEVLAGKVRYVEPRAFTKVSALGVEEQRVNVIGDLIDPPPALGAEYRIEAAIVVWTGDKVLQVPTGALFRRDGAWQAFVVEDGRARLRKLDIGQRNADAAEVRFGLKEGDQIVVFPSDLVRDGVRAEAGSGKAP